MTELVKLSINGRECEAKAGAMIIEVADAVGIDIPRFCYHEKLSLTASCRMCLVEVEKAPKALPACATPVSDGMVVHTTSVAAKAAQQATMEFLLINHPLDCPICDQGGECPLQDQAIDYGADHSRFGEQKRAVSSSDIGPLIATAMTRCIHCTRCVRFGREVAGVVELGATGRGENMAIQTYLDDTLDSEVSGNVIDLCPVGALTSKPYRFSARPWELKSHLAISPHDCLGSNLLVQTANGEVKRVLPEINEDINECWLSDRDRFGYQGVNSPDRLTLPLVRGVDGFEQVSWEQALTRAAAGLNEARERAGGDAIGALCTPMATMEEFFLLQKLMRSLGSSNVDHRLRHQDFSDDAEAPLYPGLEIPVTALEQASAVLLVGCNLRKELPLLALRLRRMVATGGRVGVLDTLSYDLNFDCGPRAILPPQQLPAGLAAVAVALSGKKDSSLPGAIGKRAQSEVSCEAVSELAELLLGAGKGAVILLGQNALNHADAVGLKAAAAWIANSTGARLGWLAEANSAGAWLAGCVPHRQAGGVPVVAPGLNASEMAQGALDALVLFGMEPGLDCVDGQAIKGALQRASTVVCISSYRSAVPAQADVVLPLAPYTESAGTYLNLNGKAQFSRAATVPRAEARPGWKILRVLANLLDLPGFAYASLEQVSAELNLAPGPRVRVPFGAAVKVPGKAAIDSDDLARIADVPIYATDPVVRRARALQRTADAADLVAGLHVEDLAQRDIHVGEQVQVSANGATVRLRAADDPRVPKGCVYLPAANCSTAPLGDAQWVRVTVAN